jgi:hypothetical protein
MGPSFEVVLSEMCVKYVLVRLWECSCISPTSRMFLYTAQSAGLKNMNCFILRMFWVETDWVKINNMGGGGRDGSNSTHTQNYLLIYWCVWHEHHLSVYSSVRSALAMKALETRLKSCFTCVWNIVTELQIAGQCRGGGVTWRAPVQL